MNRINRRRFVAVTSVAATSAVLVACGNEPADDDELNPTQIPDVPGAPPTLAPISGTPGAASPEGDEGGEETGGGGGEALTITTHDDFTFDPAQPEVYPGQTITVVNEGFIPHDLVSDDLGIGTALLNNGESEDIVIPEDAAVGETFHFICTEPGHEQSGMVGDFTIVEAGAAAPADEEGGEEEAPEEEAGAEEGAASGGSDEPLTITTHDDFSFDPDQPEVYPGQTIIVTNEGFLPHDLVSDDLGIGTAQLNGGESEEIVIPEDAAVGESFHFICSVPGHEQSGMVGDFTIVEAGAAAPAEDEGGEEEAPEEETDEATAAATAEDEGAATGGSGEPLTITTHDDFSFDPDQPEVYPGQTIIVTNEGFLPHDLVSDDLGIGTAQLNGGESEEIVIPEDAAVGESFHFICSVPGHEQSGMVGDFTIVEAGAAAPAGDAGDGEEEAAPEEETGEATAEAEEATAAATPNPEDNTPMATTIVGTQWEFSPSEFEMAPGGTITFLNNTDMMMGVSAEEWNVNPLTPIIRSVGVGNTGTFTVPEDAEVGSTIEFTSNLSEARNQGMVGTITIVEGGDAAATPEAGGDNGGSGEAILIEAADDFTFSPSEVEVTPGQTVTVENIGYLPHDLVCDDLGIATAQLNAGESEDLVIPEDAAAGESFEFICSVPGHEQSGMTGTFIIV